MTRLPSVLPAFVLKMNSEAAHREEIPPILDRVTDKVLSYKPKPKTKAAKKRARRKARKKKRD